MSEQPYQCGTCETAHVSAADAAAAHPAALLALLAERDAAVNRAAYEESKADEYRRAAEKVESERDAARAEAARMLVALTSIWEVGDGWQANSEDKPAGTTGDGHAKCRWIAFEAIKERADLIAISAKVSDHD